MYSIKSLPVVPAYPNIVRGFSVNIKLEYVFYKYLESILENMISDSSAGSRLIRTGLEI